MSCQYKETDSTHSGDHLWLESALDVLNTLTAPPLILNGMPEQRTYAVVIGAQDDPIRVGDPNKGLDGKFNISQSIFAPTSCR
jgi:hypothetical protein